MLRLVATLYWIALIAWFSVLVAAAATATSAFTNLPALGVLVPDAAGVYPNPDQASGKFAAGFVAAPVFDFAARVMWVAVPMTALLSLVQRSLFHFPGSGGGRNWPNRLREWCLTVAVLLAFLHLVVLAPRMNTALADYRHAIMQGDAATAQVHKDAFDADHLKSSPLLKTTAWLVFAVIGLSAWSFTPRRGGGRGEMQAPRLIGRAG